MAAEGDFYVFDEGVWGEVEEVGEVDAGFEFYVVDGAGGFVVEMAVLFEIGAVAGGFAVEIDLADNLMLNEGFQAVVNGGEGDVGKGLLEAYKDFVRSRMCAFVF